MDEIISFVADLDGVLAVRPGPDDGSPEISWGDTYFFYSPDGVVPPATQPFATIVTKDYPGDESARLHRPDTFRVKSPPGRNPSATGPATRRANQRATTTPAPRTPCGHTPSTAPSAGSRW